MTFTRFTLAAAVGCLLVQSPVWAQQLRQPVSVRPTALTYDYDYFDDKEEPSPSDAPVNPQPQAAAGSLSDCGCGGVSDACDSCGSCNTCCSCYLFGPAKPFRLIPYDPCGINVGFWTQVGYHTEGPNGWGQTIVPWRGFNNYPNRVQLHQQWLYIEKKAVTNGSGWDWGFRADYVYGTDGQDTQAWGAEYGDWDTQWDHGYAYGHAIPQVYAELAVGNLSAKFGKFFTILGYEQVMAPDNFFYSHSSQFNYAQPFTHTGVLFEYDDGGPLTAWGGWTMGSDTGFERNGGSAFLGGFKLQLTDNLAFSYVTAMGDFGYNWSVGGTTFQGSDRNGYMHTLLLTYNFLERWTYVVQSNLIDNDIMMSHVERPIQQDQFGVTQYLYYKWNECWAAGLRYEWDKNPQFAPKAAGEVQTLTFGVNYRPIANAVLRPEIRVNDHSSAANSWGIKDATTFGIDAIITY